MNSSDPFGLSSDPADDSEPDALHPVEGLLGEAESPTLPQAVGRAEGIGSRTSDDVDRRVYLPEPEGWHARIKIGWDNDYCYAKSPGQDYFHLLLNGEVYLQKEHEKFCLNCAVRMGLVTLDRLYWQRAPRPPRPTPL